MPFEKGNTVGVAHRFKPGRSGNPDGRPYYPQTRADAIREVLAVAEQVLTDPEMLEAWRRNLRQKWLEDPWHVLRALLPFMPRETFTLSTEIGGTLQQMTVSQLRQIVATLPDGEQAAEDAIDDSAQANQAALPAPAEAVNTPTVATRGRPQNGASPAKPVTETVTIGARDHAESEEWPAITDNLGHSTSDSTSDDNEMRLCMTGHETEAIPTLPALKGLGRLADVRPTIIVDTREQAPLVFTRLKAIRGTLTSGDYSFAGGEQVFAVERKALGDLTGCCTGDRERFERELHRLRGFQFSRLLIVATPEQIERHEYTSNVSPKAVLHSLAAWEARFIPVVFTPTPADAARQVEGWAYWVAREIAEAANGLLRAQRQNKEETTP